METDSTFQSLYGATKYTGDRPWMIHDSWDVELACKLIVFNYPVDINGNGWEGLKNWPHDKWGRKAFLCFKGFFDRAFDMATASVKAGTIKESDTPANWIKWAQSKGYKTEHLNPIITDTLANVAGRNIPLDDPVIPDTEPVELSLDDAIKINEAADLIGCTVESILRQAENCERLLYVAIKPHAAKLSAIPSHPKPLTASYTTRDIKIIAMQPQYVKSLVVTGSADISQYEAGFEPPLADHYYMLDTPQTVGIDMVYFPRSQLPADAPATKVRTKKTSDIVNMEATPENNATTDDKSPSPICSDFRDMGSLTANELTIEFVAGEKGGVGLSITAREVNKKVALPELDLFDRRKSELNCQGERLLDMAMNLPIKSVDSIPKQIYRLRAALKFNLGITGTTIHHIKGGGYKPLFKVFDKRGAADERAKRDAELYKTDSYEVIQESGHQPYETADFEDENDPAGDFLRRREEQ